MEEYITRNEHNAFADKIEAEDKRQNARISELEENVKQIQLLTVSIKEMAVNLENMVKSQNSMVRSIEKQGERLDAIEKEPAQNWKNAVWIVVAGLIGASLSLLLSRIGL